MKQLSITLLFLTLILGAGLLPVSAEPTTVIHVADGAVSISADGICSLAEAIQNAFNTSTGNTHADCAAGDPAGIDNVRLASGGSYNFLAADGPILIYDSVVIQGNGATLEHQTAGFFDVTSSGRLSLRRLTLQGSDGSVSAVEVRGSLSVSDSTFKENVTPGSGGAIMVQWTSLAADPILDIQSSVFENNVGVLGGALSVYIFDTAGSTNASIADTRFEGNGQWFGAAGTETNNGGAVRIKAENSAFNEILIDSTKFFDNDAKLDGGALHVDGAKATVLNSGFDGNEADSRGGAIFAETGADLLIERSLLYNNSADDGGGLYNRASTTALRHSTISNNRAVANGGGIYNLSAAGDTQDSAVTLDFVTVIENTVSANVSGGGIHTFSNGQGQDNFVWLQNSIVIGNAGTGFGNIDCFNEGGEITSFGYNMRDDYLDTGCPFTAATDEISAGLPATHIEGLAENGGDTRTHALTSFSKAKNKIPVGVNGCESTTLDQRGYLRSSGDGARCDIGAYEFGADTLPAPPTAVGMAAVSAESTPPIQLSLLILLFIITTPLLLKRNGR